MNYCPVCGAQLERRQAAGGRERPACPQCRFVHYRDPKVAAITLIEQKGRVLLTRRAFNPAKGRWTLPGGFVDGGEDPRIAAVRECREETGLEIEIGDLLDVFYGKAHADGAEILLVYRGTIVGGESGAGDDVDAIGFFSADALPELAFDSTQEILGNWKAQLTPSR